MRLQALIIVAAGLAIAAPGLVEMYESEYGDGSRMPTDFNYTESRNVVNSAVPGTCTTLRNNTADNKYVFECTSDAEGNYTYTAYGAVQYNQTGGNHKVIVFDQ